MRSPSAMDILVIDLTNRCFLKCSNCTRDIAHQTSTRQMSPDTFRAALASLKNWWRPGKVIGLIGGEPTLNKDFAEICKIFREEFNPGALHHGREPIADMNEFAYERLFDRMNGKGLWTSFGPKFMAHYEDVMDTFSHWNANDHSAGDGVHQTSLVDAREMCVALEIPWEEFPKYRDACWLQNQWSAAIQTNGKAYFCERAGSLDMLYNQGKLGWDIQEEPDWWQKTPDQFGEQLSICEMCAMCLPGPGQVDVKDTDIIGKCHQERLVQLGSPAMKRGQFEAFDPAVHIERRTIDRKDNYISSNTRCGGENKYIYEKTIEAVVVCVDYGDLLEWTLANNAEQVDRLIVVTAPHDEKTLRLVRERNIPNTELIVSNAWRARDAAFNKGAMLNEGLEEVDSDSWVLFTDADTFLNPQTKEYLASHILNPGCLYYTTRHEQNSPQNVNREPNGYFQLWHPGASALKGLGEPLVSEEFISAGGVDSWFAAQWPLDKWACIPELQVTHIPHGTFTKNWNGFQRKGCWKFIGHVTREDYVLYGRDTLPEKIRLTDTRYGETCVVKSLTEALTRTPRGLAFNGRELGRCHVQMAAWDE